MHGHHIAGVFRNESEAQSVINALAVAGVSRADIDLYPSPDLPLNSDITTTNATEHSSAPLARLFRSIMGIDDEGEQYARLFSRYIDRGCFVVTVLVEEAALLDTTVEVMNRYQPVDLEEIEESAAGLQSLSQDRRGAVHVFRRPGDGSGTS